MAGIQRTTTPFSGNFYDSDGILRNIDGQKVVGQGFRNSNTQINGDYYDHEGKIRNIKELLDSFRASGTGSGLPPGGTAGQALGKISDADDDIGWITVSSSGGSGVPNGGTTGQILAKTSNADGDADWIDRQIIIKITLADYNDLSNDEKNDPNKFYMITDGPTVNPTAGYWATITGDGTHGAFVVQHNLNSVFTTVKVIDSVTNQEIIPEINVISANAMTVTFTDIPSIGEVYNVYVLAIIQAAGTPGVANPL